MNRKTSSLLLAFTILSYGGTLRAEEICALPPSGPEPKVVTPYSKIPINMREIRNLACNGDLPRTVLEMFHILETQYRIRVISLDGSVGSRLSPKELKTYADIFRSAASESTDGLFFAPYQGPENSRSRAYISEPVIFVKMGLDWYREGLLHEFLHFYIWRQRNEKPIVFRGQLYDMRSAQDQQVLDLQNEWNHAVSALASLPTLPKNESQAVKLNAASILYRFAIGAVENKESRVGEELDVYGFFLRHGQALGLSDEDLVEIAKVISLYGDEFSAASDLFLQDIRQMSVTLGSIKQPLEIVNLGLRAEKLQKKLKMNSMKPKSEADYYLREGVLPTD